MLWGGCLCVRNQEPEEGEKLWFPDINFSNTSTSKTFSHKQFAELTLVNEASTEPHSGSMNDREMFFSRNLEFIFYDPPQKSAPFLNGLRTLTLEKSNEETQIPMNRPSVIWQSPPSPSMTADESEVSCLPTLDQLSEVQSQEEAEMSQADSDEDAGNTERAHSVIFNPTEALNIDIPSFEIYDDLVPNGGMTAVCSKSSYLDWGEQESRLASESLSNYTVAENFDSSDCSTYEEPESTYNSLYPSEEGSLVEEQDCVWATFTPLTPKDRTSSISSSARSSSQTSQHELTTWESHPKDELQIQNKSTDTKVGIIENDSINGNVHRVIV